MEWLAAAVSAVFAGVSALAAFGASRRAERRVRAHVRVMFSSVSDGTEWVRVLNAGPGWMIEFGAAIDDRDGFLVEHTTTPLKVGESWDARIPSGKVHSGRITLELLWTDGEGRRRHRAYWLYPSATRRGERVGAQGSLAPAILRDRLAPGASRARRVPVLVATRASRKQTGLNRKETRRRLQERDGNTRQ